jgi:hypothetical protein
MKRLKFSLLVISIIFSVSVLNFGQKQSDKNPQDENVTTQSQIPEGWKLVDLDNFSFILPESMEDKKARGIDSQVWRFENSEMELTIDSGMYKVDFDYDAGRFQTEKKWIELDKIKGQFFSIDFTKPTSAKIENSETEKERPYLKAIMFYRDKYSYSSFWIRYKKTEQSEIAEKILYSIKFKK